MAQHQFFYNSLNTYNALLSTELQDLAKNLDSSVQEEILQSAISLQLKVETFNQQAITTIEQHIQDSLKLE